MKRHHDSLFDDSVKRSHPALRLFLILLVLVLITIFTLNHINNQRVLVRTEKVTVPNLPSAFENFRILHISDLHGLSFGDGQSKIAAALDDTAFNIVCITGDMTAPDGDYQAFVDLIRLFSAQNIPVYFVPGDEDPSPLIALPHGNDTAKADYILAAEQAGAIYVDAPIRIERSDKVLWLDPEWVYSMDVDASLTVMNKRMDELKKEPDTKERAAAITAVAYQIDQMNRIREARRITNESDLHIVLTHHPLQLAALEEMLAWTNTDNDSYVRSVSLILSGHYCAGQWRLPLIGALKAPSESGLGMNGWFPENERVMGLASFLGIPQHISPGLGTSTAIGLPAFRFLNTPSVTVLSLTSRMIH
ncbi:MAG: metallophosphoesterase [Clostridiales bacterium]|nr:metallophosphoesterase [Clostridiales bacterium]